MEVATAAAGCEHRRVEACTLTETQQLAPDRRRQQHRASLRTLTEHCHLAAVGPRLEVAPGERGDSETRRPAMYSSRSRTWLRPLGSSDSSRRTSDPSGSARRACLSWRATSPRPDVQWQVPV